jgi:membrane-associated progesterone receptor component
MYIAARNRVFDVSSKPGFYGPGSTYHVFTGHDASRAFALHSTELKDVENHRIDDMNAHQLSALDDWVGFISARYPEIGFIVEDGKLEDGRLTED